MKHGVYEEDGKFCVYVNGEVFCRSRTSERADKLFADKTGGAAKLEQAESTAKQAPKFHINQRFKFLEKTVKMVAAGIQPSAVISGKGGLGKSFSVTKALKDAGFVNSAFDDRNGAGKNFVVVKGYSTAKGLFRTLFENNDSVIVMDDTDSVLKDPVAINILKAALDSYDTRVISWNADMRDDDLPRSFIFTGRVIFISNLPENKIDQAIRSRSAVIDVSMTLQETVDRMSAMIQDDLFLPEYEMTVKMDALQFIDEKKDMMSDVNLRTLITVAKVRAADEDGTWKEMAEYLTCR